MKVVFLLFVFAIATLLEFYGGVLMLPAPLLALALVTLYFSFVFSPVTVFPPALLAGLVLDLGFDRPYPFSGVILLAALLAGRLIRPKAPEHLQETALCGLGSAFIAILGGVLASSAMVSSLPDPRELVWHLLFWGALGFAVTPLLVLGLDAAGRTLGIEGAIRQQKSTVGGRLRPRKVREAVKGRNS